MKYYYLEPEVAGGIGKGTVMNTSSHSQVISKLNYEFDGWLGDELIEAFPVFITTEHLSILISKYNLTGFTISEVEVSKSGEFKDLYNNHELPNFVWFQINGQAGKSDFGIAKDNRLVVSQTALDIIKPFCTKGLQVIDNKD